MLINHCNLQFIPSTTSNLLSSGNVTGVFFMSLHQEPENKYGRPGQVRFNQTY